MSTEHESGSANGPNTCTSSDQPTQVLVKGWVISGILIWVVVKAVYVAIVPEVLGVGGAISIDDFQTINDDMKAACFVGIAVVSAITAWRICLAIVKTQVSMINSIPVLSSFVIAWLINPVRQVSFQYDFHVREYYLALAILELLVFGIQATVMGLRRSLIEIRRLKQAVPGTSLSLPEKLRRRAHQYRVESRVSLGIILVSLIGGSAIFIAADAIAAWNFDQRIALLVSDVGDLQRGQERVAEIVTKLGIDDDRSSDSYTQMLRELERIDDRVRRVVGETLPQLTQWLTRADEVAEDETDVRRIVSSLATRVGAIFFIIFLVRILANLYQYSARMVAHYESRADILSHGKLSRADTMGLLSTDDIDFGRVPRAPTAEVKEMLLKIAEAIKGRA